MSKVSEWGELKETIRLFTVWTVSSFIDTTFLALWVLFQWIIKDKVIVPLELSGMDHIFLTIFQVLFAISSLAPVGITIYRDIRIMLIRTQRRIRTEIKIGERQ